MLLMENQWEPQIRQFESETQISPPPEGCVVFTGSSTIAMWQSLQMDFPFIHAINRGFGGSLYADLAVFVRSDRPAVQALARCRLLGRQ